MVSAHEVDVQARHDEHVALAKHIQAAHDAIQALKFRDTVDFGSLQHGLRAAQDTGHVRKQIFGDLVAHGSAEAEEVWGEEARHVAWGGGSNWQQRGSQGGRRFKDLESKAGEKAEKCKVLTLTL
jgi:hypothetical protein